jgi:hypothetical protein
MARRGRPKKSTTEATIPVKVDHAKILKQFEQEQRIQLETLYKDLASIRKKVDYALSHIGFMHSVENLGEAAFKAGRAYGPLDEANDKLQEMLDEIYDNHDFDHWEDVNDN